jgi:O-antigen ligase
VRQSIPIAAVILGVVVFTTGPMYRIRTWFSYEDPLERDVWIVAVQALFAVAGVAVLSTGQRWRRVDPLAGLLGAALIGWLLLGMAWSLEPGETAREALLVGGTLVAGAAAATVLSARALLWSLWAGTQIGLAWSALAIWVRANGSQDQAADWVGVFFNRNSLALVAAIGLLTSGLLAWSAVRAGWPRRTTLAAVGLLVAAALADLRLLLGSDSLTPLLAVGAAAAAVALALGGRMLRRRGGNVGRLVVGAGLISVAVASVGWVLRRPLTELAGRDSDFSGRAALWEVSWDWFTKRPLVGQGYLAAWNDEAFLADVLAERGELLFSAHNSFIEVLLGGGVIGAALLVAFVAVLYWSAGRVAVEGDRVEHTWPLALFAFVLVEQLSETLLVGGQITVAMLGTVLVTWSWPADRRTGGAGWPRARRDREAESMSTEHRPEAAPAAPGPR